MVMIFTAISQRFLPLTLVFILLSLCIRIAFSGGDANTKCIERERHTLLKIKQDIIDEHGHLSSWGNEEHKRECCRWRGVSCNKLTGHVTKLNLQFTTWNGLRTYKPLKGNISSSLLELQHLQYLNLRFNYFDQFPHFIGSLKKLRHLDLSYNGFIGRIPYHQIQNLSNLQYLDFSNYGMYADKLGWLSHLSFLRYVGLNNVELREANDWQQVVSSLPFLTELQLNWCNLQPVNSSSISFVDSFKTLAIVSLSGNNLSDSIYFWLSNSGSKLVELDLSHNYLRGPIPDFAFQNMNSLKHLRLKGNQIVGIQKSLANLCRLETLYMGANNLTGDLPELFINLPGCAKDTLKILSFPGNRFSGSLPDFTVFQTLKELNLHNNRLNGSFPKSFGQLSDLKILDLHNNQLEGSLPDFTVFASLKLLDISHNHLNGTLTKSIANLSYLELLDVSSNLLEGLVTEVHLSNLSKLQYMDLSYNLLSLHFSSDWIPPFQLRIIGLGSCKLGPRFPKWLQTQYRFSELDISGAEISDFFPEGWDLPPMLNYLNLSNNNMRGMLSNFSKKISGYLGVDLSSNYFEGSKPSFPVNTAFLILSNNKFSGSISSLCEITGKYFGYLDLSDNHLSGELPDCSKYWQKVTFLNLANNDFSGKIPNSFDCGCTIESLHLRNNSFTGELPSSLKSCQYLKILDLGSNNFSGKIPPWIGYNVTEMVVLSFRSNQFYGSIPTQLCNLAKAQVLDFSQNSISGTIPECLNNLSAIAEATVEESSNSLIAFYVVSNNLDGAALHFEDYAWLVWKGIYSEYKSTLGLARIIDFSSNMLSGHIPEAITSLVGLISLNLSRNSLTGSIPSEIGQLNMLNSLDLSNNLLIGEIPESFSRLDALGVLNLSNNNLSGKIPWNTKLQSFDASTYLGNPELCGSPLPKNCPSDEPNQNPAVRVQPHHEEGRLVTLGFYVGASLGFIVSFWGVFLLMNRSWIYILIFR